MLTWHRTTDTLNLILWHLTDYNTTITRKIGFMNSCILDKDVRILLIYSSILIYSWYHTCYYCIRSNEWSKVSYRAKCHIIHVMGAPLGSMGVPLGSTSRVLPGRQMMYEAKHHTELSIIPYIHMVGVHQGSVGVPLGSITSQPWFSCSPDTSTELNTIHNT